MPVVRERELEADSYCEHTITVLDTLAPSLTVDWPADRVEVLGSACDADLSLDLVTASATDNCDGHPGIYAYLRQRTDHRLQRIGWPCRRIVHLHPDVDCLCLRRQRQ